MTSSLLWDILTPPPPCQHVVFGYPPTLCTRKWWVGGGPTPSSEDIIYEHPNTQLFS